MALTGWLRQKFDERYMRINNDAAKCFALLIWYSFLLLMTISLLILIPDTAIGIVSKIVGI